jgi:hypothetical protein
MRSRPAFLLCGAFLIAASPVWADSVFYTGIANESVKTEISTTQTRSFAPKFAMPATAGILSDSLSAAAPTWSHEFTYLALPAESTDTAISAKTTRRSVLVPDAPQNDERLSDPTPAIASIGGFDPYGAFGARGSEPSFVVGTLFPPSSDATLHSSTFTEFNSHDRALSALDSDDARFRLGREHRRNGDGKDQGPKGSATVDVPEPGAFSLLLFGLAAVGILARRRGTSPATA